MDMISIRRKLMASGGGSTAILATATGNPLSFVTDMVRPLKSLEIPFTPIQSGSGNPSPTNVRPISGWTGCNITQAGKNLYNANALRYGYYTADGNYNVDNNLRSTQLIKVTGSNIAISWGTVVGSLVYLRTSFFDKDKVFIERHSPDNSSLSSNGYRIETCPSGTEYIAITFEHSSKNYVNNDKFQIELGSTVTTYEAYHVTALPVTFTDPTTSDPLTVYGGTLTLNEDGSVDLVKTHGYVLFDGSSDESISKYGQGSASAFAMSLGLTRNARGNLTSSNLGNIRSNYLKTLTTNATWGNYNAFVSVTSSASRPTIECGIKTITTVADFRAYLAENPLQIAYLLYTPQTYHFDNIGQLITFVGTNNIWTDTNGTNTATYLKHQS